MSDRLTIRVYKGAATEAFLAAVERVAIEHDGAISWGAQPPYRDRDFRTSHHNDVHAVYLPYLSGDDYLFCEAIGASLSVPWLELRVQEGSHWDYSLYRGGEYLENFSTLPEYWGDDDPSWIASQRGNPQLLADVWRIELSKVENYSKQWGYVVDEEQSCYDTILRGKAYPDDEYEYGDCWQVYDFLRTLGGLDPCDTETTGLQHSLKCPNADAYSKWPLR
jgi:hypothetical protein